MRSESSISLLADGKTLICIIRMDAGDGHASGKPYAKRFSTDQVSPPNVLSSGWARRTRDVEPRRRPAARAQGRTWGALTNMTAGVGTAKPRVLLMGRSLVLIGGRPGNVAVRP